MREDFRYILPLSSIPTKSVLSLPIHSSPSSLLSTKRAVNAEEGEREWQETRDTTELASNSISPERITKLLWSCGPPPGSELHVVDKEESKSEKHTLKSEEHHMIQAYHLQALSEFQLNGRFLIYVK